MLPKKAQRNDELFTQIYFIVYRPYIPWMNRDFYNRNPLRITPYISHQTFRPFRDINTNINKIDRAFSTVFKMIP